MEAHFYGPPEIMYSVFICKINKKTRNL